MRTLSGDYQINKRFSEFYQLYQTVRAPVSLHPLAAARRTGHSFSSLGNQPWQTRRGTPAQEHQYMHAHYPLTLPAPFPELVFPNNRDGISLSIVHIHSLTHGLAISPPSPAIGSQLKRKFGDLVPAMPPRRFGLADDAFCDERRQARRSTPHTASVPYTCSFLSASLHFLRSAAVSLSRSMARPPTTHTPSSLFLLILSSPSLTSVLLVHVYSLSPCRLLFSVFVLRLVSSPSG